MLPHEVMVKNLYYINSVLSSSTTGDKLENITHFTKYIPILVNISYYRLTLSVLMSGDCSHYWLKSKALISWRCEFHSPWKQSWDFWPESKNWIPNVSTGSFATVCIYWKPCSTIGNAANQIIHTMIVEIAISPV